MWLGLQKPSTFVTEKYNLSMNKKQKISFVSRPSIVWNLLFQFNPTTKRNQSFQILLFNSYFLFYLLEIDDLDWRLAHWIKVINFLKVD